MSVAATTKRFQIVERDGPAGRRVLIGGAENARELIVIAGYQGRDWPDTIANPSIQLSADPTGRHNWRLTSDAASFEFAARDVLRIELRPELYAPLHRPFALSAAERVAARALLLLLRLPGGARLLRRWHTSRST